MADLLLDSKAYELAWYYIRVFHDINHVTLGGVFGGPVTEEGDRLTRELAQEIRDAAAKYLRKVETMKPVVDARQGELFRQWTPEPKLGPQPLSEEDEKARELAVSKIVRGAYDALEKAEKAKLEGKEVETEMANDKGKKGGTPGEKSSPYPEPGSGQPSRPQGGEPQKAPDRSGETRAPGVPAPQKGGPPQPGQGGQGGQGGEGGKSGS